MNENFETQIKELLKLGNKIAAIKMYREKTGDGLAEAKSAVESLEAGGSFTEPVEVNDSDLTTQIVSLLGRGEKIQAVKLYRQRFGVGLKDAKDAVERIGEQNSIPASSGIGCLGVSLMGIGLFWSWSIAG